MFAVKVFDGLEQTPWYLAAGTVANTPGIVSRTGTLQSQPGVECAFFAVAPEGPFADAYWYKELGAAPLWTRFRYAASFLFPTQDDSDASQALELDLQQVIGGQVFNLGWQMAFVEDKIRVWDRSADPTGAWVPAVTGLPRWKHNQWYRVVCHGLRTDTGVLYTTITVNDFTSTVNLSRPLVKAELPDMLNVGVQLDAEENKKPYRVMVDAMSLTVWEKES